MALTNFAALTTEQKTVWSMEFWRMARNSSFVNKFMGTDANSVIQRVTELKKSEKGARAVITLIADIEGDGVVGDNTLEGNEEAILSYDKVIQIDQMRNANRHKGRMADQKSIVDFRKESRDQLAYWYADRIDQLAFLTLSGVAYSLNTDDSARTGSQFPNLSFASDVVAPSTNRHLRWDAVSYLTAGNTANVAAEDTPTYRMIVELKAYAKEHFIRGVKDGSGDEVYHLFLTPTAMAKLRMDPDFLANVRHAGARGNGNELFKGTSSVLCDGVWVHEFRHVYHASDWGGGAISGCRGLFCGAQALAFADIGPATWDEEEFDYGNQQGISIAKIVGMLKPQFYAKKTATTEDFGLVVIDMAQ
jgi:N4-gp56 family major capsid protein